MLDTIMKKMANNNNNNVTFFLFSVSKFTCSPKKESEKLKNSHFGQIYVQFVLFTVSY